MPLFKRQDGDLVKSVHPLRRLMPLLMPTRAESFVLCSLQINAARSKAFLKEINANRPAVRGVTRFHLLLQALSVLLRDRPGVNRFIAGGHLYQRRGSWIAFVGKQRKSDDAGIFTIKREFLPGEKLVDMVDDLYARIGARRSGKESDKKVQLLLRQPYPLQRLSIAMERTLNRWNLLPQAVIAADPFFASVFVANLGSLGLDAFYHHNFEHGTCSLFVTLGRTRNSVVVSERREPQVQETFDLKLTYDQRVEDGFYCVAGIELLRHLLEEAPEDLL